jgi:cobalt-zinc-cadmium efflux system membrane fusion protein
MSNDKHQHAPVLAAQPALRDEEVQAVPRLRLVARLGAAVPNLLVLLALGGLAAWGSQNDWKLPRFAELGGAVGREKDDWCAEHAVPESVCVECDAKRWPRPKPPRWCAAHGVHECPWEHPEVAQLKSTPPVTADALQRARAALDFAERPANSRQCKLFLRRIQFASEAAAARAGVEVAPVWEAAVTEAVSASGEVRYEPTRVARLSSRVRGTVWRVDKAVGEAVRKGEVLALVDAAEVGKAKGEFLQSVAQLALRAKALEALRQGYRFGAIPEAKLREGQTAHEEAQIRVQGAEQALATLGLAVRGDDFKGLSAADAARRVRFLGLPDAAAKTLETQATTTNLFPLTAPLDGVVVWRQVVAGEGVDEARVLFTVADNRRMLLTLRVREEDAQHVRPGQAVRFRPDGGPEAAGVVAWVSTGVDRRTRTVEVRAGLDNASGRLRDGGFGAGRVVLRHEEHAVVVPSEAVQWEGDCHVVFVRDKDYLEDGAPKVFHTRTVRTGAKDGGNTEIIAGVLPGEIVVAKGSALLRSELLKNSLGEG